MRGKGEAFYKGAVPGISQGDRMLYMVLGWRKNDSLDLSNCTGPCTTKYEHMCVWKKNQPGCQGDPCWEKERRKILSAEWQLLKYAEERKKQRAVNIVS